jgi:hypothetical protein
MAISRPRYHQRKRRYQRKKSKFQKGYYKPINESKYIQPLDRTMNQAQYPEYRSSWEKKFMEYCDKSPDVLYWSTEYFPIPYVKPTDNKVHRYYPDLFVKTKDKKYKGYIIEIKPHNQINSPINQAKFKAAEEFCNQKGYKFLVITEKELKAKGII